MAGKKQHHIWRMLQRGFGKEKGGEYHIWVYKRHAEPVQKGSGNFGVAKYFYGEQGSETDRFITLFENKVQSHIQEMRKKKDGEELENKLIAELIAHLEMRSQFLRLEMSKIFEKMQSSIEGYFSSETAVQAGFKEYVQNNPNELKLMLSKNLIHENQHQEVLKLSQSYLEGLPPGSAKDLFGSDVEKIFQMLDPNIVKKAHNKSILALKPESSRVKALCEFEYSMYRPERGQLILPDTCVAFVGANIASPFWQYQHDFQTVIVPISSNSAIIGRKANHVKRELQTINRLLAGCAYDAFIMKNNDQKNKSLVRRIGKHAKLMSDKEIREAFEFG